MTVNGGGPQGSNILVTHPKHKKMDRDDGKQKNKPMFLSQSQNQSTPAKERGERRPELFDDLPQGVKDDMLGNLLNAHSSRIGEISADDLSTAFKSLRNVRCIPTKITHEGVPAILASYPGRSAKTIITVTAVVQALS